MREMTGTELRVAIAQLGVTQEGLGEIIHVGGRTIRAWVAGDSKIPATAAILIRILVSRRNWGDLLTIGYGG